MDPRHWYRRHVRTIGLTSILAAGLLELSTVDAESHGARRARATSRPVSGAPVIGRFSPVEAEQSVYDVRTMLRSSRSRCRATIGRCSS